MTFLEYVCEHLMGPPLRRTGGRSIWPCPECDDQTAFGTLPHKPEYKDRVYCHRCCFRGDVADIIRFYHPREGWPRRRVRIDQWRQEYLREVSEADLPAAMLPDNPASSIRGGGIPQESHQNDPGADDATIVFCGRLDNHLLDAHLAGAVGLTYCGDLDVKPKRETQ